MSKDSLMLAVVVILAAATFTISWNEIERKGSQAPLILTDGKES